MSALEQDLDEYLAGPDPDYVTVRPPSFTVSTEVEAS